MKRRNFVKTLASLAAVGSLPGVASAAGPQMDVQEGSQGPAALSPRIAVGNFALQIDGAEVGWVESVEGGNAVAEVVVSAQGTKTLGTTAIEPLRVTLPLPPVPEITKLLGETVTGGAGRHTIGITAYDLNMKAISQREFLNAILTEVAIERLEVAAKNPISLQLTFQAEQVRTTDKTGGAAAKIAAKQKAAMAFRFTVSGIDGTGVGLVEMPQWKRTISRSVGEARIASTTAGRIDLGMATAQISLAQAQPWLDWFDQFVIQRKDTAERTAKLELLSADLQTVLYTVSLSGVGIAALRAGKYEAGKETVAKLEASLYAERINYGS